VTRTLEQLGWNLPILRCSFTYHAIKTGYPIASNLGVSSRNRGKVASDLYAFFETAADDHVGDRGTGAIALKIEIATVTRRAASMRIIAAPAPVFLIGVPFVMISRACQKVLAWSAVELFK
jgi:hypothetical protein